MCVKLLWKSIKYLFIINASQLAGIKIVELEPVVIRKEVGVDVNGWVCVAEREK